MTVELTLADVGFDPAGVTVGLPVDHMARVALLLDVPPLGEGEPLPLLWHWTCLTPGAPTAALGPDGHPRQVAALAGYPRRMWGAGAVNVSDPLVAGFPATRRSLLVDVDEVDGRSGPLLIARVEHVYTQLGTERVWEAQTIVYRAPGPPVPLPSGEVVPRNTHGWQRSVDPDPRLLFRYSAVTFNSHRIHYDLPYAREVEGYPALVVQCPLSASIVAAGATADAGRPLASFAFRTLKPLFAGLPFTITGRLDGTAGTAQIMRNDGAIALEASYTVEP